MMELHVTVAGEGERTIDLEEGTYGDVIEAVGLSVEEATVLIDGTPVPEDRPIDHHEVTVLRLIHGG